MRKGLVVSLTTIDAKGAGCITYRIEYMVWWMVVDGGITLYGMASLYLGSEPLYRSLVAHPGAIE